MNEFKRMQETIKSIEKEVYKLFNAEFFVSNIQFDGPSFRIKLGYNTATIEDYVKDNVTNLFKPYSIVELSCEPPDTLDVFHWYKRETYLSSLMLNLNDVRMKILKGKQIKDLNIVFFARQVISKEKANDIIKTHDVYYDYIDINSNELYKKIKINSVFDFLDLSAKDQKTLKENFNITFWNRILVTFEYLF